MFPAPLETDGLVLDRLCAGRVDVFELYDRFAAGSEGVDDVFAYVPQEPYTAVKDARDQLVEAETAWEDGDSAQYAVYTGADELAGYAGLFPEWDRRMARVGFTFARSYWGRGYAGECARALTDLAFDRLDLDAVALDHAVGNERSERAIETFVGDVGGQHDGRLRNWRPIGDEVADHHRYTVTREQYRRASDEA